MIREKLMKQGQDSTKDFYSTYHDQIASKRFNSPYWLRRYVHRQIHAQFLPYVKPGDRVLDAGCGEGVLSCLVAQKQIQVTGVDLSAPNLEGATKMARSWGVQPTFMQGDAENLPFPDNSFDVVISSHVLEHLPNIDKGLAEIYRITRSLALIAMPTCLNPAAWALLGGDSYYRIGPKALWAIPFGFARVCDAFFRDEEGPNEGYGGNMRVPHVWRFPWVMKELIASSGFKIQKFEAGPLILPYLLQYLSFLRPFQSDLDRLRAAPILRNLGYGSMAVCVKPQNSPRLAIL